MGVSALARLAADHAHAFLVEVPGHWRTRAALEGAVLARGWVLAASPADADVLVICGSPGSQVSEAIEAVWHHLPGPRVRIGISLVEEAASLLDEAHAALLQAAPHHEDARQRPAAADLLTHGDDGDPKTHGDMDHGDMDHGDMDHGDMDHGDMDMSPGGIPLAGGGPDRDGLEMDVINVRLGPILPLWPAGLVLRCCLQGDVLTDAEVEVLDAGTHDQDHDRGGGPARSLDNLVSLFALAGWDAAAGEARRLRDAALRGDQRVGERLRRLDRRVRRSLILRWSLRGLGLLNGEDLSTLGLPDRLGGDTYDRLLRMLERAGGNAIVSEPPLPVGAVRHLVTGLDLAAARLVVASLDLQEMQFGSLSARGASHA